MSAKNPNPDMSPEQKEALKILMQHVMESDDVESIVVLRLKADGSVLPAVGSRRLDDPDLERIAKVLVATIRSFNFHKEVARIQERNGQACQCPNCIARRNESLFGNQPKAQA